MVETRFYVFSLSAKDPSFEPKNIDRTVKWLRAKHDEPYYFREKRPKSLPKGSTVLFSFEAQIFGQATVKIGICDVPEELKDRWRRTGNVVYKYQTVFDENSVRIFSKPYKRKGDLKDILFPKKYFGQLFTPLTPNQYDEMLRRIER